MRQQGASLYSVYIPWRLTFKMYVYFAFGELSDDFLRLGNGLDFEIEFFNPQRIYI